MGVTLFRGDPGFDEALLNTSFNARDPGRRPDCLVQANSVYDVIAAVNSARKAGQKIAICSGGHSWSQNHIRNGGLLIDVSRLNGIEIDSTTKIAIVGPGTSSGDLNRALANACLFFPVAHAYTVGMAGFLLWGGYGWGSRAVGIACESVIGIDVVLADGRLVHAGPDDHPDLYWASRGSGTGFFGVVVRFHLKLRTRPKFVGLKLQVFRINFLEEVWRWADRVGPEVPAKVEFQIVINRKALGIATQGIEVVAPVMAESYAEAKALVTLISNSPLKSKASLNLPLLPLSLNFMMKSAERTLFLRNKRWQADNMWVNGPIEPILPNIRHIADTQPPAPSHILWMHWNPVTAHRGDMAFSTEARTYLALYAGLRSTEEQDAYVNWATDNMRSLEDHSAGIQLGDENLGSRTARFVSDNHLARLDQIRAIYDPEGRFHAWMGRPSIVGHQEV
jgi:FAD/FMN-containing dehydrogenase